MAARVFDGTVAQSSSPFYCHSCNITEQPVTQDNFVAIIEGLVVLVRCWRSWLRRAILLLE